jgi:hypothetical protein
MNELNILLGQSFSHMAGSEEAAKRIVEDYKSQYEIKKSLITKKVKKGVEYWVVSVTIDHVVEKEAFEMYFGE